MEIKKEKRTLAQAMLDFRVNVDSVTKDSDNPFFKSKYASYNNVQEAINPTLDMLGMCVVQAPMIIDGVNVLNTKIYLADSPSDMIEGNLPLLMPKNDMQALGSAMTYARRISLVSLFGLAAEDDDGHEASQHPKKPTWENKNDRNDIIVDMKLKVDEGEIQEAIDIYLKRTKHEDKKIEEARLDSVWNGLSNEYKTPISIFRRKNKQVA